MSTLSIGIVVALLAASAAGVAVYRAFDSEIAVARAEAARGGKVAVTSAGPIEYAEQGTGPPLLSIHGAGGGYDQGLLIARDLVGSDFRVIAPSRFGYLGTPVPPDASVGAQAEAHVALLDALGIEKAVVVGTSAGARSALELVLRHPQRVSALILLVPGTYAPTSPVMVEGSRASRLTLWVVNAGADFAWWVIGKLAPTVLIRFLGVPPETYLAASEPERRRADRLMQSVQPLAQRFRGINLDSVPDLHRLPLGSIMLPTLIVSARDDLFNTLPAAQFAAGGIPRASLAIFETGGHLLVGRESQMRELARNFLIEAGTLGQYP